ERRQPIPPTVDSRLRERPLGRSRLPDQWDPFQRRRGPGRGPERDQLLVRAGHRAVLEPDPRPGPGQEHRQCAADRGPPLGQRAQPGNGADFRGFVALDVRNFATDTSQLYYNNVTAGTGSNTLKAMESNWITVGGYPGPQFPATITPPDANDQVGIMSGNSTGAAIDAAADRFVAGDEVLVLVYPGDVMSIPDFTVGSPGTLSLPTTGTTA